MLFMTLDGFQIFYATFSAPYFNFGLDLQCLAVPIWFSLLVHSPGPNLHLASNHNRQGGERPPLDRAGRRQLCLAAKSWSVDLYMGGCQPCGAWTRPDPGAQGPAACAQGLIWPDRSTLPVVQKGSTRMGDWAGVTEEGSSPVLVA